MKQILTGLVLLLLAAIPVKAQAVSIELVLAVDTSASVNDIEYALQMRGIAAALESEEIVQIIGQHKDGVAIALLHWSGGLMGKVAVDWTIVSEEASVRALARQVAGAPRSNTGNYTAIGNAISRSMEMIATNGIDGEFLRIDVSGDGRNNSGEHPSVARNRAINSNITINGLAILDGDVGLAAYYKAFVAGGPGSFVLSANGFEDFGQAMRKKLGRELSIKLSYNRNEANN